MAIQTQSSGGIHSVASRGSQKQHLTTFVFVLGGRRTPDAHPSRLNSRSTPLSVCLKPPSAFHPSGGSRVESRLIFMIQCQQIGVIFPSRKTTLRSTRLDVDMTSGKAKNPKFAPTNLVKIVYTSAKSPPSAGSDLGRSSSTISYPQFALHSSYHVFPEVEVVACSDGGCVVGLFHSTHRVLLDSQRP